MLRDLIAARAEDLPEDLSPEEIYARLFAEPEESHREFLDTFSIRRRAWESGQVMRKSKAKGRSPAQIKKIREYLAWLNRPADVEEAEA